ncbi:MAG: hypothetical protein JOZ92_06470 [Candidatus Dormibacteraeota bacterium]|nr:hypothetical protein [Candidatus Dormibacteraeota bacterium]
MNEDRLRDVFSSVEAPESVSGWRERPAPAFRGPRPGWLAPMAALAGVVVIAAGLGAYFGIRAATGNFGAAGVSAVSPSPRFGAAMTYDEANGAVVLFGGMTPQGQQLDDTWTWSGSGWVQQHPAHSPTPSDGNLMAYDPVTHDVLLEPSEVFRAPQAGWLWDGNDWKALPGVNPLYQQAAGAAALGVAGPAQMATDPASGRIVLVETGGFAVPGCPGGPPRSGADIACPLMPVDDVGGTYLWNGSSWTHVAKSPQPQAGLLVAAPNGDTPGVSLAFVTAGEPVPNGCAVPEPASSSAAVAPTCQPAVSLPFGSPYGTRSQRWNGSAWGGQEDSGAAWAGGLSAAAFDAAANHTVFWSYNGTVLWNGSTWTQAHPSSSPAASLAGTSMAYDAATQQVILTGTVIANGKASFETWLWNGSAWTLAAEASGPAPAPPSLLPAPLPSGSVIPEPATAPASPGATPPPGVVCPYMSPGAHPGEDLHPICPVPPV